MEKPIFIMHISDLHFGKHDNAKLQAIEEFAKANKPDLICVTGDITQNSRKANFDLAKRFLDKLIGNGCKNIIVIPGNHDAYTPRGRSLKNFTTVLGRDLEPSAHIEINGKDVICLGVDTTESYYFLNTRGKFRKKSRENLEYRIENYKTSLGKNRVKNALKILLVHHHPISTPVIDRFESTLYFKNAGDFLTWAFKEQVDLVLHGHQHDPILYTLDSDVGPGGDAIPILSAGTATKITKKDEGRPLSLHTHFYSILVYDDRFLVSFNNYRARDNRFIESRVISKKRQLKSPIEKCSETIKYIMTSAGDLREEGSRSITPRSGSKIEDIFLSFGIDQFSDPCPDREKLNLKVKQDGENISNDQIEWIRDEKYAKSIKLRLNKKVESGSSKLTWSYLWPGGFAKLLRDYKDTGTYMLPNTVTEIDRLKIIFELDHEAYTISQYHVTYLKDEDITLLNENDDRKRGFEVKNLNQIDTIGFEVHIT